MNPHITRALPACNSQFTLPRSGGRPLSFAGVLLASAGEAPEDKKTTRWHELKLYRAASGVYVVSIQFRTSSRHDRPYDDAFVLSNADDLVRLLEEYDPVDCVIGWPVPQYADKDRRMRDTLEAEFELLVSQLLTAGEFAEKV